MLTRSAKYGGVCLPSSGVFQEMRTNDFSTTLLVGSLGSQGEERQ
jgi:hypothetical protein